MKLCLALFFLTLAGCKLYGQDPTVAAWQAAITAEVNQHDQRLDALENRNAQPPAPTPRP